MIAPLKAGDEKRIIELWTEVFKDTEEYVKDFLNTSGVELFTYTEGKQILGMVSLFDVTADGKKGGYIYALAVDERYRENNIATKLLSFVDQTFKKRGYSFAVVVPEPFDKLENFYKKRGFTESAPLYITFVERAEQSVKYDVRVADCTEYQKARNAQSNIIYHSGDFFEYVCKDALDDGADFLKISDDNYCICYNTGDCVIIKETVPTETKDEFLQAVMRYYNAKHAVVVSSRLGNRVSYALIKRYDEQIPSDLYANLFLDSLHKRL